MSKTTHMGDAKLKEAIETFRSMEEKREGAAIMTLSGEVATDTERVRRKAIRDKFEEFKSNWHTEIPLKVKSGHNLGNVDINFDFVSYLMRGIRSHLPWGTYKKDPKNANRFVDLLSLSESLCQQYVLILHEMVGFLGMPSVFVHFKDCDECPAHWGLDVELVNDHWAFFDPTFCLSARGPLPLNSLELKTRPKMLELWQENFNQYRNSFDEDMSPPAYFKRHIDYWRHYNYFFVRNVGPNKSINEEQLFLKNNLDRTEHYLSKMGRSCSGYLNESRFIKI